MRRGIPTAGIVGIVLVASGALAGVPVVSVRLMVDRRWELVEEESRKRAAELGGRPSRRPILRGSPEPGNAFVEYSKAMASYNALTSFRYGPSWEALQQSVEGRGEWSREQIQAAVEPALPALDQLRRGARCEDVSRWRDWENDPCILDNQWRLQYVGICRMRFLVEEGRVREAVDLLLDLFQHATDQGRMGTWFENYLGQHRALLGELRAWIETGILEREYYLRISRELAGIDGQIQEFGEGMLNQAMREGFHVLRTKTIGAWLADWGMPDRKIPMWKCGFSEKLALAQFAVLQLRTAQRIAEGDSRSWAEARRLTAEASASLAGSTNPLVPLIWATGSKPDYVPVQRGYRETRAQLRLMRAAVGYLATGTVPDLEDPFGDRLKSGRNRRGLKIWSVGGDGVDDGGSGSWNPREGRDIVLEIRR